MTPDTKDAIKRELVDCLASAHEINKIVIFGSFLNSDTPNDLDVAVFVDNEEKYLSQALKFRKLTKTISKSIPLDIIPIRPNASGTILDEINKGELIYDR